MCSKSVDLATLLDTKVLARGNGAELHTGTGRQSCTLMVNDKRKRQKIMMVVKLETGAWYPGCGGYGCGAKPGWGYPGWGYPGWGYPGWGYPGWG
jgi:hypothetical protein